MSIDIVRSWLDSNAVITTLINKVREFDVISIHRVETISILYPVRSKWSIDRGGVAENVVKPHIGAIHDV